MPKLKTYATYKNSGTDFIGNIPDEWSVVKLKYVSTILSGYAFKSDDFIDDGIPIIRISDIKKEINWEKTKKVSFINEKILERFIIQENDILIAMTGATIGKTAIYKSSKKALINQRVGILRNNSNYDVGFLGYVIESYVFREAVRVLSYGGAQENIGTNDLENIYLPLLSLFVQKKIASFLNQKTSEIDALISDKEKLIELLEEKRQATITEVVTKGLNPDLKMKDSGVEWIGEIPEHWGIIKLKYLFNIRTGGTPKSNNLEYWDDKGIIWITPGDLSFPGDTISDSYKKISESGLINSSANYISKNSIVISTRAPIGNMKIATMEYTTNQGCKSLESKNENHNIIYYFNLLRYRKNVLESLGQGTTFLELSSNSLKEFEVPVMNKEEQDRIVEVIQSLNNISDKLLVQINKQIYKLKEYRQALIYEAVTGKIDVQEMVKETEQEEVSPL